MGITINAQLGLLDSLMFATPTNEFLERLAKTLDWKSIEKALQAMYPAVTGRPPCAPLALFQMSLLQHGYGLSDPPCEKLVSDRLSWRRGLGLGLQDQVLQLVNRQLEQQGFILKTCTLVAAPHTLIDSGSRA